MKLTKNIKVKVYEVLADYKVKVKKSSLIAILKFAYENGGEVTSSQLYSDLLQPLSKKACENILERLLNMGYFKKEEFYDDDFYDNFHSRNNDDKVRYSLTELGYTSALQEEFYENRNGVLKIFTTNSEFIEQKVVAIKEVGRQQSFEQEDLQDINTELINLQSSKQHIILENGTFILDNFQEKCRTFKDESKELTLRTNETHSILNLMSFRDTLRENYLEIRNEILRNEFDSVFLEKEQLLKVDFDTNDLALQKNLTIHKPTINRTIFSSVIIENVNLSPENINGARNWFKALIIQRINRYFLSKSEFNEFSNKIAQEFELFYKELENYVLKEDIVQELDTEKDFYKKAKLETIDYLNY